MAGPRLYVNLEFSAGDLLTLPAGPAHHLVTVLRRQAGSPLVLFNGQGGEHICVLEQADRKAVMVRVGEFVDADRRPPVSVHLGMCVLKKDAMDAVLGRVAELGVAEITPLISDHCALANRVIRRRQAHWQAVVIASCEQCGLNRLPLLHEPQQGDIWMQSSATGRKLIAVPAGPRLDAGPAPQRVSLLVGPEGGFSDRELSLAVSEGFDPVTFGERILRSETAPAVALSVLNREWGDF